MKSVFRTLSDVYDGPLYENSYQPKIFGRAQNMPLGIPAEHQKALRITVTMA